MKLKVVATGIILALSALNPVFAYDKTDEKIIRQDVAKMKKATLTQDMTPVIAMMPESFFQALAKETKLSVQELKDKMLAESKETSQAIKELNASMDYTLHWNQQKVLKSKTGRDYVWIPTTTRFNSLEINGTLIAIKDNGQWYYLQYQPQLKSVIQKAYPDIKLPKKQ